ncbi:MAG: DUF6599 family protein [bacterium]
MKRLSLVSASRIAIVIGLGLTALAGVLGSPVVAADFPSLEGYTAAGEVEIYGPDNLWQYNNGAADLFLAYGFEQLQLCELTAGENSVTVGVYDMGSRLNAYGMYNAERPDGLETVAIGAEALITPPYQGLMLKDRFYVKTESYTGGLTTETGTVLLTALAENLPGTDGYPPELALLPAENLIADSFGYTRESFQGMSSLRNCVHADYQLAEEQTYQVFLMYPDAGEELQEVWNELAAKWKPAASAQESILVRQIPYKGTVGLLRRDVMLLGVSGLADESAVVEMLRSIGIVHGGEE